MTDMQKLLFTSAVVLAAFLFGFGTGTRVDKPEPIAKQFTQEERNTMKAQAIQWCMDTPNCHLHARELEWLVNYDVKSDANR